VISSIYGLLPVFLPLYSRFLPRTRHTLRPRCCLVILKPAYSTAVFQKVGFSRFSTDSCHVECVFCVQMALLAR
jgi:hypothetical protein